MSGRVEVTGLRELRHFLRTADDALRSEATTLVRETTEQTAADVVRGLPRGATGTLRARVRTIYPTVAGIVGVVLSAAPHAHLVEFGTRRRRTSTGANRGRMPATPVTPAIAERNRSRLFDKLVAMVRRFGFEVSGT